MPNLDPIRRALDAADPIPPWLVRGLCDRLEKLERLYAAVESLGPDDPAYAPGCDCGKCAVIDAARRELSREAP